VSHPHADADHRRAAPESRVHTLSNATFHVETGPWSGRFCATLNIFYSLRLAISLGQLFLHPVSSGPKRRSASNRHELPFSKKGRAAPTVEMVETVDTALFTTCSAWVGSVYFSHVANSGSTRDIPDRQPPWRLRNRIGLFSEAHDARIVCSCHYDQDVRRNGSWHDETL